MKIPAKLPVWACQQLFLGSCAAQGGGNPLTTKEMAELALNVLQVIQNELISREGSRSSLGLGSRLSVLEERLMNVEAITRNGKVWKLHHQIAPVATLTPDARDRLEWKKKQLLERKGAKKLYDDKDPTMLPRKDEWWEVHDEFPRLVLDFKELQFYPDRVQSLLEFYEVRVYRPDLKMLDTRRCKDVLAYMECCLEELAMRWGLDWEKIGGMTMPAYPPSPPSSQYGPSPPQSPPLAPQTRSSSPFGTARSPRTQHQQQQRQPQQQQQQQQQRNTTPPPQAPPVSQSSPTQDTSRPRSGHGSPSRT